LKTQEFKESGLLESHLMGFTNREEQQQIREMVDGDEALADYVSDLEAGMRSYFNRDSVNPPHATREIVELRTAKKHKHSYQTPPAANHTQILDVEVNDTHIKVHKLWRPAFIAVFILSKIFLIAGLYFYFKSLSQADELNKLKTQVEQTK
jgi:hypothetical protein